MGNTGSPPRRNGETGLRLFAILGLGFVPWSVVFGGAYPTLVFSFGLVDPTVLAVSETVYSYTFVHTRGLSASLFAWPLGTALYLLALGSALAGAILGREDRRVTAGLLVLVALTQATFAWGFAARPGYVALPVVSILAVLVVWLVEWPAIRGSVLPTSRK